MPYLECVLKNLSKFELQTKVDKHLQNMNKVTLITGATSGIGLACAYKFAQNKHDLILTGRRKDRLEKLAYELKSKHAVSSYN